MKQFYLFVVLVCGLGLGFIAITEIDENTRLKLEINDLKSDLRRENNRLIQCLDAL